jgi:molybdate transport system substrate-binding protein
VERLAHLAAKQMSLFVPSEPALRMSSLNGFSRQMRSCAWRLCAVLLCTLLLPGLELRAATVNVFAAASLTESLKEAAAVYSNKSQDKIVFSFGASSTLARQIEEGAPADIFFSADEAKMNELEKNGLIVGSTRRTRLSNTLVIVVAVGAAVSMRSAKDLAQPAIKRIALGDPRAVPIGVYARQYLERLGLWKVIEPKVVVTENVRAALAAVETGDADASIVYRTDAMVSKKVQVAFEVPLAEGPHIAYPMAVVKSAIDPEAAKRFLEFLNSKTAGEIFEKHGFALAGITNAR